MALLDTVSRKILHPYILPVGRKISANRAMDEDALYVDRNAWCNEQARVFVRLCQAVGVPARIIHLFYQNYPSGHTIAEFHNGQNWCMADVSYFLTFRAPHGQLLSAAQCHDKGENERLTQETYKEKARELIQRGANGYFGKDAARAAISIENQRKVLQDKTHQLHVFGVINYPLPRNHISRIFR